MNFHFFKEKALELANDAKLEGNRIFVDMKFEEALVQYDIALQTTTDLPSSSDLRSICHSNRVVCFLKLVIWLMDIATWSNNSELVLIGKYEETVKECRKALEINPSYVKALRRRGEAHEKLEHFEKAIAVNSFSCGVEISLGKLKEMGNSLLGRFGMSLDNFKAVKDPHVGSYSISFQN
ncbi:Tetratricopeptide repeat protein 1 [Linum grandiflorum]